jgi:flagellin-like hook-associated protein FlgL
MVQVTRVHNVANTVSVFLNQGDGTFGIRSDYNIGINTLDSPTIGDLDGDGYLDLVTNGQGGSGLKVWLNNRNGTFGTATTYSTTGSLAYGSAVLADINGDNRLDVLFGGTFDNLTHVRLNNGNGTFGTASTYNAGGATYATPSLGDLNGDGLLDLVQANRGTGVAVRLNQGDGTFGARSDYSPIPIPTQNTSTILADLNNDGRPDMVQNAGTNVSVLFNQGNGTFGATQILPHGGANSSSSVADLNGDGWLDIVQSDSGNNWVSVFMNQRNGTFGTRSDYAVGTTPTGSSTIADVNLDGRPDIVQSNSASGTVSVLTNQGDGTFNSNQAVTRLIFSDSRGMNLINHINLRSQSTARAAMDVLDSRMSRIAQQQGVFGGVESRLAAAQSVVSSAVINYRSANSRIKDTDVAEDSATLVRTQMLQQAGAAVLAQANVQPQIALRLLQGS